MLLECNRLPASRSDVRMCLSVVRQLIADGGSLIDTFANYCEEGIVSSNSGSNENKDSKNAGSYTPEWQKRSLDIVPPNDQDLPKNPVAEAIMGVDSPSNQTPEQSPHNSPNDPSPDQSPAES